MLGSPAAACFVRLDDGADGREPCAFVERLEPQMPPRLISMLAVVRRWRREQYQSRLVLQPAHPRHVQVEDEALCLAQVIRFCRSENLRLESYGVEESLQCLANRLVIVHNRDERRP